MKTLFWFLAFCGFSLPLLALELSVSLGHPHLPFETPQVWSVSARYGPEVRDLELVPPAKLPLVVIGPDKTLGYENGTFQTTWTFTLSPVRPGTVQLPSPVVRYLERGTPKSQSGPALEYEVAAPAQPGAPALLPPLEPGLRWGWVVAGLGLSLVLALPLGWWLRRPQKVVLPPPVSPETLALARLQELENRFNPQDLKGFHVELSLLLKTYLTGKYGLPVWGQTTEEFLWSARRSTLLSPSVRQGLDRYFHLSDQVKFAAYDPGPALSLAALEEMRAWIAKEAHGV
ncbi:MAG: hypothetical protein A2600_13950 [Candidatus Lambdaproteobacteria bacterium RIFOXYD1_FULL_56_27]|uniref:DUF4381 domain-containing protein n=1 Tax=Candidatus Lambdaproteobacteria bacterium RIFOXYD2_FULL_56_26 TaxID=1817773 RepID=A0A1F6GNM3_9PROT|nr:MAG: hypothetical protein A2557_06175 [Candidatus Lambdaproteobacteria bacterium RIFOXYD2_FULL_56_26]OGG99892.1 MAG: hypothetical protein A2426_09910 [Candidatus Lambdaproteobacteria bacterium RIFOXYC1_FULL_56_13]OGH06291.1 MAG: hypothetical protein A2600_13950 [Candidatus Lambdaproteobacteria bacterium RIFOXYD1_FULL_56_27]